MSIQSPGRRIAVQLLSFLSISQATLTLPLLKWSNSWWVNRSSIVLLAGVNTAITAFSEYGSRTLLADDKKNPEQQFFVPQKNGSMTVHKQSIVNILMTIIASLLGGPVYFIRRRWPRFMFFISFGAMNSALSQMLAHQIIDGYLAITLGRFVFDLVYNGSFKFLMFEFARPAILKFRKNVMGLGLVRVVQDFLTTLSRVGILNWLGF